MKLILKLDGNASWGVPLPAAENDVESESSPQGEVGDEELIRLAAGGDGAAFAVLVDRHTPSLYRVAYRMLRDQDEAEDIVQETFSRLWKKIELWRARDAGLVGWLHRVAINLCFDKLRKPRLVLTDEVPEMVDSSSGPEQRAAYNEAVVTIELALLKLPEHHRAALILTYNEGLSNLSAAEALDMHIKAFESMLCRARKGLQKVLEEMQIQFDDLEVSA